MLLIGSTLMLDNSGPLAPIEQFPYTFRLGILFPIDSSALLESFWFFRHPVFVYRTRYRERVDGCVLWLSQSFIHEYLMNSVSREHDHEGKSGFLYLTLCISAFLSLLRLHCVRICIAGEREGKNEFRAVQTKRDISCNTQLTCPIG